ncbi:MAG: lipocalin family protein [Saprospiraceae bacterium]|nr:lipocalin family protein [Saprospiraceae bacterium]
MTDVGKWKLTNLEYRENNSSTWTFYQLESWRVDDFVTFSTNGTGIYNEGPTKKRTEEPQTRQGEWYLAGNDKLLSLTDKIKTFEGEIVEISDSKLVLIGYKIQGSSNDFRFTLKPFSYLNFDS